MTEPTDIGPVDVEALIEQCRSDDHKAQIRAVMALRDARAERAVDAILPLLDADGEVVRLTAVDALARLGERRKDEVGPAILARLRDADWSVRSQAAEAMGTLGHAPARQALEQMLLDDEEWVPRASAAEALGEIGDAGALAALEAALSDEYGPVRAFAANSIGLIGEARMLPVLRAHLAGETDRATRSDLLVAAIRLGDGAALDELFVLLSETTDEVSHASLYNAVDDLLWRRTPAVVIERARELDRWLAGFGADALQARLAKLVAGATRSKP